jgi:hypothetical protein
MSTVNEALNIPMSTWENDQKSVDAALERHNTISDALLEVGNTVKNDEFDLNGYELSLFERRLLATGYILGCDIVMHQIKQKIKEDPSAILKLLMG